MKLVNHNNSGSDFHHTSNKYMNSPILKFVFKTIEQNLDKIISSFQNEMSSRMDKISIVLVNKLKDVINKPLL